MNQIWQITCKEANLLQIDWGDPKTTFSSCSSCWHFSLFYFLSLFVHILDWWFYFCSCAVKLIQQERNDGILAGLNPFICHLLNNKCMYVGCVYSLTLHLMHICVKHILFSNIQHRFFDIHKKEGAEEKHCDFSAICMTNIWIKSSFCDKERSKHEGIFFWKAIKLQNSSVKQTATAWRQKWPERIWRTKIKTETFIDFYLGLSRSLKWQCNWSSLFDALEYFSVGYEQPKP